MSVDDVGLEVPEIVFDLVITYGVVQGADGADEFGYNDNIIFLIFGLFK